ncbi:MAG: dihydroneopterin triphosphate 2'-epimerase [Pseudomonadota bacterium]
MNPITIHIKNLRLRTYIGFNQEELEKKQDVIINIDLNYNATTAMLSDQVSDACNYKILTKKIIKQVESNRFNLLEKMAAEIMKIIQLDSSILYAEVKIDKPHALRFADSVSVSYTWTKD